MKLELSRQIFKTTTNIKFNENPSGRSRVVPYGGTYGQTHSLIVDLRNFASAPKNTTENVFNVESTTYRPREIFIVEGDT
jgi:hypothetical protein